MEYRIDARYVWYETGSRIVLMYFINSVPFTFDELPDDSEDIYRSSQYLILEECHPLMFELELENPEMLPVD
jgi:hypothetical protein